MNRQCIHWALVLLALQVVDVCLTRYMIAEHGATELNPLMAGLVNTPAFLISKLCVAVAVVPIAGYFGSKRPRAMMAALRVCVAIYVLVTLSNAAQLGIVL